MEQYTKKYPDAQKTELAVSLNALRSINYNKRSVLREYFKSSFEGLYIVDCWYDAEKVVFVTSESAYPEEQRQLKMKPGTIVKMNNNSFEVKNNPEFENKEWKVLTGPEWMGDCWVVWLDGFSGAYSCELLEIASIKYPTMEESITI